jgi:hypothetical protein
LADDCDELQILRSYRDGYMSESPAREEMIKAYYALAPEIVSRINQEPRAREIFAALYEPISECV